MLNKELKLVIGSDHAGYKLKEYLKKELIKNGYELNDYGTNKEESVDYPDYAHPLAEAIEKKQFDFGILICGSGNGVNMVANKYKNIRAALCWNVEVAKLARLHNDANIISLPARFIDEITAIRIVETFLKTEFEGGRHQNRVKKISDKNYNHLPL
jgi:ribose 5-phosphate isomerase B